MRETPNRDKPGFVAKEPEHCSAWFRVIHPGQTYYLAIEHEVLCADCASAEIIRVKDDLAVEVKRGRLLVRHGKAEVEVFPGEVRHLVNALAEAAVRLVRNCVSRRQGTQSVDVARHLDRTLCVCLLGRYWIASARPALSSS